jgi:competence ComEA-like helix-hairpin-helix protein
MPFRLPQEALPRRSQPLLAGCVAGGLALLAVWLVATGALSGGLVHHDAAPVVPLAYTVDVNSAGVGELMPLPGLGPALAARIVDHRTTHGRFTSTADLLAVPGIGPATLDRLLPHLRPLPGDPRADGTATTGTHQP